jgi:general secretion pathway protein K
MGSDRHVRRGGALLAVLWLSAALAAIAFAVAISVRGEVERAGTAVDSLRAYYLARGAVERAFNYMIYGPGPRWPDGRPRFWEPGQPWLRFAFPGGEAVVDIIPESSRLNVNQAPIEELARLLAALGLPPAGAAQVAAAIVDWRAPSSGQSPFDPIYLALSPSFRAPHASLEQIEELLSVQGVTPDLYYGRYDRTPEGALVARAGLRDCLSVYSSGNPMDLNTVEPETMLAVGAPPEAVHTVVELRRHAPIVSAQLGALGPLFGPAFGRFRLGGDNIYTLRATARPRLQDGSLSDVRRSVAMVVQLNSKLTPDGFRVLRWRDNAAGERMLFDPWLR